MTAARRTEPTEAKVIPIESAPSWHAGPAAEGGLADRLAGAVGSALSGQLGATATKLFGKGWEELEGIANRGDYDLLQHERASGEQLTLFVEDRREHVRPYVVEPAAGLSRATLVFLIEAYEEQVLDAAKNDVRTVLHLHPSLAPYKVAVFPLSKKPELLAVSRRNHEDLRRRWVVTHDVASGIGKAYRR